MRIEANFRNGDEEVWDGAWYVEVDEQAKANDLMTGLMTISFYDEPFGPQRPTAEKEDEVVNLDEVLEIRITKEE